MRNWERHSNILDRMQSCLVVVDMQEPFLRAIHDRDRLIANVRLLIEAAKILQIPIIATTQYAERMGGLVSEIAEVFPQDALTPIDKLSFSCMGSDAFRTALSQMPQVVICGVETHICVSQTALDLVAIGVQVHVPADAVSSRSLEKHKLGMERLRDSHVLPCAAEAVVYEWLREAGTPEFKSILQLVK